MYAHTIPYGMSLTLLFSPNSSFHSTIHKRLLAQGTSVVSWPNSPILWIHHSVTPIAL